MIAITESSTNSGLLPPSQATLCWQGQKRTSRASSEQMRHSLGPGSVGRTRLVMVLGVVWTRRRLALLRPCPHVMACRRCNLTEHGHTAIKQRTRPSAVFSSLKWHGLKKKSINPSYLVILFNGIMNVSAAVTDLCFSEKLLMSCSMLLSATRSRGLFPLWLA